MISHARNGASSCQWHQACKHCEPIVNANALGYLIRISGTVPHFPSLMEQPNKVSNRMISLAFFESLMMCISTRNRKKSEWSSLLVMGEGTFSRYHTLKVSWVGFCKMIMLVARQAIY